MVLAVHVQNVRQGVDMTTLQRIRAETGQSAVESIKWYAETGYSRTYTALSLGICRDTLKKLCDRFSLDHHFKPQSDQVEGCRQSGAKGRVSPARKYTDAYLLAEVERHGTLTKFKQDSPIAHTTIYFRFGSWSDALKLSANLSDKNKITC